MTLPLPHARAVERIARHIEDGDGLFIVCVGEASKLEAGVVEALAAKHPVARVVFTEASEPWEAIAAVGGAVASCSFEGGASLPSVLTRLNVGRERLNAGDPRVLLWVRLRDVEGFVRAVPDLWSYRSDVLRFLSRHDFDDIAPAAKDAVSESVVESFERIQRELEWATGRRRAELLIRQARIAAQLGHHSRALAYLDQATPIGLLDPTLRSFWRSVRFDSLRHLSRWRQVRTEFDPILGAMDRPDRVWMHAVVPVELALHSGRLHAAIGMLGIDVDARVEAVECTNVAARLSAFGYLHECLALCDRAEMGIGRLDVLVGAVPRVYSLACRVEVDLHRAETVSAIGGLHRYIADSASGDDLGRAVNGTARLAVLFDDLGLPEDAAALRQRAADTRAQIDALIAQLPALPEPEPEADPEPDPIHVQADAAIARAKEALAADDLAALRDALDLAQSLWEQEDPQYPNRFQAAALARLRAALLAREGDFARAADLLTESNAALEAATLHTERVDTLLALANLTGTPEALRERRVKAAREALLIAETAGFVRKEHSALTALQRIADEAGDSAQAELWRQRAEPLARAGLTESAGQNGSKQS
ncbi:MAG: hypothetical protein R3A52_27275 [Polyangiales bacterium]